MKRLKMICSAIAAFSVLALAGCDLTIPESQKVEYAAADFEVETLPYVMGGVVVKDAVLEPLEDATKEDGEGWTVEDGVSLSFYLTGYTSDWSMTFQVPSANFGTTTSHICNNKTWVANNYGCADGNGTWDDPDTGIYERGNGRSNQRCRFYRRSGKHRHTGGIIQYLSSACPPRGRDRKENGRAASLYELE